MLSVINHGIANVAITLFMAWGLCAAGRSEVADAAMQGDKSVLRTLLQQKADVNGRKPTARPPCSGPFVRTTWK